MTIMTLLYKLALILFLEPTNNQEYIIKYYPIAYLCELKYGVPASIQLAQAIQESGAGRSNIAKNSNNHFGIKYYKKALKSTYQYDLYKIDKIKYGYELLNRKHYTDKKGIKWRAYNSIIESYIDHAKFLNQHYRKACFKPAEYWSKLNGYGEHNYWQTIYKIVKLQKL